MAEKSKKGPDGPTRRSSDPRFSIQNDPRFKFPKKEQTRIKLDNRFGKLVRNKGTFTSAKRDPYGRKVDVSDNKRALGRLYKVDAEEEVDDLDDDDEVQQELARVNRAYDPARQGGFESSSSDESSSDEDEDEDESEEVPAGASMQRLQDEAADVEMGEVTRRIAIVNLDWDHVKATDLFAVFTSFAPKTGKIEKVSVYPSEFGKERMQVEDLEGPPKELFKSKKKKRDEESSAPPEKEKERLIEEGDDQDFDRTALRKYQIDRLRYYYAVLVCSDEATAKDIYDTTDGREYLSSSNFFDLRFVPDDVSFDDEPRDECDSLPVDYKPVEFVTHALQHSKVQLTWDMHPEEVARKDSIKRAFAGSKDAQLENDLKAYLASDTDGEDDEEAAEANELPAGEEAVLSKKELARKRLREKLGLKDEPDEPDEKGDERGPVGNMTVIFGSALLPQEEKKEEVAETTIEKYKRKERERREKRKAQYESKKAPGHDNQEDGGSEVETSGGEQKAEDLGFDDPFFTTADEPAESKTKLRKEDRRKKREAREAEEEAKRAERENLALILGEEGSGMGGYNMAEIKKAERQRRKKNKKNKHMDEPAVEDNLEIKLDQRFPSGMGVKKEWAVAPTDPQYMDTRATRKLTEELTRKRRDVENGEAPEEIRERKKAKREKKKAKEMADAELKNLVAKVKMKSKEKKKRHERHG